MHTRIKTRSKGPLPPVTPHNKLRQWSHTTIPVKSTICAFNSEGYIHSIIRDTITQIYGITFSQFTVSRICNSRSVRRRGHSFSLLETRGRKRKYTEEKLDQIENTFTQYFETK